MKQFLFSVLFFLSLSALVSPCYGQDQKYALVIGITGYPHFKDSQKLRYADDDAKLFYDFIQTEEGGKFPAHNIRLLLDSNATREHIFDEITWLHNRVEFEDIVYIFFSGHGVLNELALAYFMPYMADPERPEILGFRADRFVEELRLKINSKYMVLFIDACHSGSVFSRGIAKGRVGNITRAFNKAWEDAFNGQDAISMAFLSASSNQSSYEDTVLGQGVFTYYLVEGMKGAADRTGIGNKDDVVTAGELYRYILDKVEYHAKYNLHGKEQSPTKSPQFTPSFPFGISGDDELVSNAENARKHFNKAYTLYEKGDRDGEIEEYRTAISIDPNYFDAYYNLGTALLLKGDLNGAIEEYRTAISLDPNYAKAHNNLGIALKRTDDLSGAIAEYETAIRIDSTYTNAYINLGNAHYAKGNFDGAIDQTRIASRIDPNNAKARNNLGNALEKMGDIDGAIKEYQKAIRIDPNYSVAHYNLGKQYERKGQTLLATQEFESYVKLVPNAPNAEKIMDRIEELRKDLR